MIKQCKGKDLAKVPASKLLTDGWYSSIKYDGNYIQIHKKGDDVKFFTSGNKEFYLKHVAEDLLRLNKNRDFIVEAEYINSTEGKLGDRVKAAKLTTYRTNFAKGYMNDFSVAERFMVFDIIYCGITKTDKHKNYNMMSNEITTFESRIEMLKNINLGTYCKQVEICGPHTLEEAQLSAKNLCNNGYEGLYIKHRNHTYRPGKRINDAIKLKLRPTADLLCTGIVPGEGKYLGMIGSLELVDEGGKIVYVGSGLSDEQRGLPAEEFDGKTIEIEYEQIIDTYIQPTFVRVRDDK